MASGDLGKLCHKFGDPRLAFNRQSGQLIYKIREYPKWPSGDSRSYFTMPVTCKCRVTGNYTPTTYYDPDDHTSKSVSITFAIQNLAPSGVLATTVRSIAPTHEVEFAWSVGFVEFNRDARQGSDSVDGIQFHRYSPPVGSSAVSAECGSYGFGISGVLPSDYPAFTVVYDAVLYGVDIGGGAEYDPLYWSAREVVAAELGESAFSTRTAHGQLNWEAGTGRDMHKFLTLTAAPGEVSFTGS